jgi:hypothetical protein
MPWAHLHRRRPILCKRCRLLFLIEKSRQHESLRDRRWRLLFATHLSSTRSSEWFHPPVPTYARSSGRTVGQRASNDGGRTSLCSGGTDPAFVTHMFFGANDRYSFLFLPPQRPGSSGSAGRRAGRASVRREPRRARSARAAAPAAHLRGCRASAPHPARG